MLNNKIARTCLFCLATLGVVVQAQAADTPDGVPETPVVVELEGLADAEGTVYIAVYDNDDDWLSDNVYTSAEVNIAQSRKEQIVSAEILLPPGQYAMTVFHDVNGNGELDTNFIGLPKEPIAMSNNAKAKFGPPKYEDAVFDVVLEPVIQRISVKQL